MYSLPEEIRHVQLDIIFFKVYHEGSHELFKELIVRPNVMEKIGFQLSIERWVSFLNTELGRRKPKEQEQPESLHGGRGLEVWFDWNREFSYWKIRIDGKIGPNSESFDCHIKEL